MTASTDGDRELELGRALTLEAAKAALINDADALAAELTAYAEGRAGDGPIRDIATRDFRREALEETGDLRNYFFWHWIQARARGDEAEMDRAFWGIVAAAGAYEIARELRPTRDVNDLPKAA